MKLQPKPLSLLQLDQIVMVGNMARNIIVDRTGQNGDDLVTFGAETGIFS